MATPEVAASALRQDQYLRQTREWLGKPIFKDEKRGYKEARRYVSDAIDNAFQRKEFVRKRIEDIVERCSKERSPITPASIALKSCLDTSNDMRRELLLMLVDYKKEKKNRPIEIAALDVIKGFQLVLGAVNSMYGSSPDVEELDIVLRLGRVLLASGGPKGFTFVRKQAQFWSSPLRVNDGTIEPYEVSELIGAGAKLAPKTYKRVYPIAQKVLSSGN